MSVNKDQVKKLYDATSQDYGIDSFKTFVQSLNDDVKRKEFFDLANVKYDIGNTLEEFENNIGIKKKILAGQQPLEVQIEDPEDPKKKKKAEPVSLLEQFRVSLKPLTSFQSALPSQSEEKRKGLNYWSNLYSQSDNQLVLDAPKVSGVNLSKSDIDRLRKLNTNKDRYVEEAAITAAASGASASEQQIAKRDAAAKYDNLSKGNKVYVGTTTALGGVFVDKAKVKDGAALPLGFQSDLDAELGKWDMKSAAKSDFKPPVQTFTTQRVKATNEFFLSPDYKKLSDDAATNLQSLTTRTNLGELVVDKSKLRSWMSSQFKKYDGGDVGKNSYFTDMVQARLVDDLSFEIDRPEVIKQAGIEYERMYGKKMSDEAGTFQTEQIKKLITPINENYKNFADKYVSQARAEISKLNETYNSQVSELNSKYEDNDWITLWGTEFFGKIPQGQDPKKFIEDQYKKDFNALRNTYLTQHAAVSAKHKAELGNFEKEYKTAVGDLQKGVEFTGYGTDYGSKVKAAFTSAAKKVYKNKDDQRRAISESIGWVFPRALTSGVSNVVSSAATFLDDNLQAGWVGWLKDQTQDWADAAKLPSNPIQSWSDLLDPAKVQQNLGEQLPNLAVSIGAALATKRPVMMANLGRFAGAVAMGTAGTLTENIQRQGQILQDLISQGVDPSEASNKSRKIWRSAPIDIAINSFQMELLLGKIAKGSFLSRFATTAVGENLTEIPQEIRQTREEEQITGGAETPTKEIALSVLPTTTAMSLLGAGSGAVKTKEKFAPTWLNNIAAYPFNKIAEQVINSSKGAVQAANSMNAVNGIIRTDALETMNNVVEGVQAHVDLAKQNGLNKDQQTAYVTLMATAEDLKKKIEDAKANNAPQERVDQLSTQFTNASNAAATLLSEKSGNYAVVLDEDGDRIVMTHDQLEQSLADGNFQDGVRSGAISVDVNATVMSDERVKSILNTLSGLNSRFNQSLATYENESDMTKSLQQKLGIEDGAVQTPSTNAMTMVGKPVVQKLGDVEVVGDLKVMGGYLVIENDEMVRPIGLVEDVQNLSLAELNMVPAVQDQVSIQTKTGEEINIPSLITMYAGRMNPNALVKNIMAVAPNVNEESLMSAVLAVDNAVRNGQRLVEQEKKPGVSNPKLQVATAGIGKSYSGEKVAEVVAEVGDKTSKTLMQKVLDILSFNFIGQEIDLDELYEKDQAFAQRVEQMRSEKPAGNVEQSKRVFNSPENTPAIIIDDKVYDGYSRLAQQYINGQKTANAFVSTGSNGKKYTLETAQPTAQDARPDVQIDRSALTVNAAADVQRLKAIEATGAEDGATMNIDGTTYTGGGLVVPVISLNTTQEELTPEAIADFVEQNKAKLGDNKVFKVGLYKFPGSNKVSIDLNIVANRDQREMALDFARRAGQESLFDLDTFENVKTGATGETPMQFTDQQFAEIAKAFGENRMPNVFGEQGKTLAERLREKINAGVGDRVSRAAAALRATGIQIRMIEDPAEFERATSQFGGQKTTEGIFIADTGEILMNKALLDKGIAAGLVVWHEASHPIVNIIRNTNPELYTKLVAGLKQAAKTNAGIRAVEEWAENEYAEYGAFSVEDETIVETIAGITEGTIDINNIPVGIKQSIIEFINRIASLLGLGQIIEDTDLGAFKKLAGDVANALRTGTDISEIIGAENVKEYGLNIGVPTQLKVSSIPSTKVSHKGGQYDLSFVSKEDIVDIESLIKDISAKGQNVWFWTADQLGRGAYFDKTINGEHYLDAGPSFALDPDNRNRGIIWATGKGEKWVNDKIANSDYIFIISGSPTKSKLFNKRVAELTINRIKKAVGQDDSYRKFRTEVLAVSKITDLNNILNRHESFESLLASPDRKQMLIKFDEQKAKKGTPLKALLEGYDAFIDYNELRDGFYKENGFDLNDVMLVLKPTGYGGKSAHSTYENDVLGEVVGVPDKKINAFDIMTDEFKAQYASDMSRTEQSQVVAPYGAGVKKVQMSKGNRAVAQAMSDVNKQMTEDDQGNYVFYHYSNNDLKKIDPAKFGRNLATGRDERPGVGLSMYYTSPDVRETMVPSDYGYVVRIQKDNVYPFNEDPLELLPIAEREFNKKFPGQAFDLNKQVGFVTKVAADRGYKMTVAKWNIGRRNVLRAQTVEAMKPERFMSKKFEGGFMQEKINPKLDFVPNAKKRGQMSKGNRISTDTQIIDGFYSPIENRVNEFKQPKASATKWKEIVGAKSDEAVFSGLADWLNSQKPDAQLSKQDVMNFMKDNRIEIKEVTKRDTRTDATKYSQYQLPGGENYKEVLITLPAKGSTDLDLQDWYEKNKVGNKKFENLTDAEFDEIGNKWKKAKDIRDYGTFKSSHFDEPNIITHLRMNTRTDADGKKVLFLEEVQSDWGQKGKREGFEDLNKQNLAAKKQSLINKYQDLDDLKGKDRTLEVAKKKTEILDEIKSVNKELGLEEDDYRTVPVVGVGISKAPFVTNTNAWVKLGLKYALKEAVRQGADRIAWTTGEQQNERYDLSTKVDEVWYKDGRLVVTDKNGAEVIDRKNVSENELPDIIGKEAAEKLVNQNEEDGAKILNNSDLKIGGKGMKAFYGDANNPGIVANVAKALVKELTGKEASLIESSVSTKTKEGSWDVDPAGTSTQPAIEIAPELRQEVKAGMPQFSKGNRDNEIRQFIRENIGQYSQDEISQAIQDELGISKEDADAMVAAESKGQAPLAQEIQTFQEGQGEEMPRAMADQFDGLAPEVEAQIDDDARTYFAKTNKQTDEEVDNFINGKDMAALADYVVSNPNIPARVKIWMAAKVAKNLGRDIEAARANGDQVEVARLSEKQANIYNTFAREATELGQAVQAFVAFNDDPNAINFFLNKILRQLKERGVDSITDQQRNDLVGLMQAVSNARPGLPKNKAVIQLSHYLGRLAPVKLGDVLQSIWYAHILSGVTTQLKNIYANTTMLALELPIGATWQSMKNMSLMPYVYAFKGLGSGMFKGIVKGADILRGGITEKDANKFFGTEPVLEYFSWKQTKLGKLGGGAVGKFLDFPLFIGISPTALKMVGRALSGADAFFSTTAQEAMANMLAYNEAVAEGKSGITPNGYRRVQELLGNTKQTIQDSESTAVSEGFKPGTMEYKRRVIELVAQTRNEKNQVSAEEFGKRVTLTNEPEGFTRGVYQVATSIQQYMPIARVVIPFTRIVSNISEMIINYSPAGAYRALTGIKNPKLSFKFSPDGDNKLSDEARGELFLKSSMAIAAVALLMDNVGDDDDDWFDITGGGPTDFQKKYELMKGGWRPYTITLKNGKKISYADWPIAGALSGLGTMRDIQQYENEDVKKNESRLGLAAYGYATAFYDKSLIKGISDFVDLFRLKGKYGPDATSVEKFEKFMANQAKAMSMTNFSQQVFKLIQEYNDDPIKEAKGWESLYRDLPVINDGLNPIIDVFGDPVTPSTTERLLPWMTVKDEKKDAMIEMLNKKGIFIGIPEQKPFIELDTRTEREMTRDELYRYRKMSGEYTKAILVNRLDDIKKAADRYEGEFKQKAWEKMIGNVVQAARKRAYVDLLMNKTTDINKMFEDLND